jgi:hypothetical protein
MDQPIDQAWKRPGAPVPVVPSLVQRIAEHSPELVLQIQYHLEQNGEPLEHRTTYDGTDASARLAFAFVEALLTYEQLRLELLDQTATAETMPSHMMLAMSDALQIEPALLHLAKTAFQMHLYLWNAHEGAVRSHSSDDEKDETPVDRGRWDRPETDDG